MSDKFDDDLKQVPPSETIKSNYVLLLHQKFEDDRVSVTEKGKKE
jgi:hypothetical protein